MRVVSLATGTGNPTECRNLEAEILNAGAARDPLPEEPWTRDPTCLPSFTRPCSGSQQCQGLAEASCDRAAWDQACDLRKSDCYRTRASAFPTPAFPPVS